MKATIERQVSVAIENQPGRLGKICRTLARKNISISGFSVIDNIEQGMVRLVADDAIAARQALIDSGLPVVEVEVLVVEIPNGVGQLAQIGERLEAAEINIEYAYATGPADGEMSRIVLKTASASATRDALMSTEGTR